MYHIERTFCQSRHPLHYISYIQSFTSRPCIPVVVIPVQFPSPHIPPVKSCPSHSHPPAHCQWLYVRLHVGLFASHLCRCVLYVYELRYACIIIHTYTLFMNIICSLVDGCAQLLRLDCLLLSAVVASTLDIPQSIADHRTSIVCSHEKQMSFTYCIYLSTNQVAATTNTQFI